MTSELVLLILRVGFLLLLWFFIFSILYALRSDLFGAPVRKLRTDGVAAKAAQAPPQQAQAGAQPQATKPAPASQPPVITPSGGALPSAGAKQSDPARKLVITSGVASGTEVSLDDDFVTIGRSPDSTLVIVDEYTSTYHARLSRTGNDWKLTDLDSTNGTRLNGEKVTQTVSVPLYTPVTIGQTTFELRP